MPTMFQASIYSAVTHYLRAIDATGTDEAKAVMTRMKAMPTEDFMTHSGVVREDGRVMRPMYLMQVKTPAESRGNGTWRRWSAPFRRRRRSARSRTASARWSSASAMLVTTNA